MSNHAIELLKEWYYKADKLENAHMEASNYYHKKDIYIEIPSIFISALCSTISFTTTGLPNEFKNYFLYIAGGLNVTNTIIVSIKEYFSWSRRKYKHNTSAIGYQKLKNQIEIQLSLHKMGAPISYDKIISEIGILFIKLDNDSPQLPEFLRKKLNTTDKIIEIMANTNTEVDEDSIDDIVNKIENKSNSDGV